MPNNEKALALFQKGFTSILEGLDDLGYKVHKDLNFLETAGRAARGFGDLTLRLDDIKAEVSAMLDRTFPAQYDQMVISKHNVAFGLCPHHLLPVIFRISVAYIPKQKVLGISKLSRMCQLMSRRPVLQEDLTNDLAHLLHERLESQGGACYIEGLHMCMAARGVQAHEARVVTSALVGVFREQPATRQEFLNLVTSDHPRFL
jgi:GTP cyclohydrolase IA